MQSLIDDVINSVNNLVYQGISSLEKGLTATPPERLGFKPAPVTEPTPDTGGAQEPEYPDAKKEIEEGLHQLETLLENTVDKNFDKFEILVLRNVLCVPEGLEPWVRLKHYEVGNTLSSVACCVYSSETMALSLYVLQCRHAEEPNGQELAEYWLS